VQHEEEEAREFSQADFEGALALVVGDARGDPTEGGAGACLDDDGEGGTLVDDCSHVRAVCEARRIRFGDGDLGFWRWHGLTGQNGFVTLELIDTE